MASANLELVQSIYAAWERGDISSAEWAHPEIEFGIADGPSPGSWRGVAGMAQGFREILNAWEEVRIGVEEYRELDAERVLVLIGRSGRGRSSGLDLGQISTKGAILVHIRRGEVTRLVIYWSRERAYADLGVAPEEP